MQLNNNLFWVLVWVIMNSGCRVASYNVIDSYIYEQNKTRDGSKWSVVWEAPGLER